MMAPEAFGDLLRRYRLHAADGRWSQQWLADRLNYQKSHVSRWEHNRRQPPPRPLVLQIGDQLGLSDRQLDNLLEAAAVTSVHPERYRVLGAEERSTRNILYGPSQIPSWEYCAQAAVAANRAAELWAARDAAGTVCRQIEGALALGSAPCQDLPVLWSGDEIAVACRLYLLAVTEVAISAAVTDPVDTFVDVMGRAITNTRAVAKLLGDPTVARRPELLGAALYGCMGGFSTEIFSEVVRLSRYALGAETDPFMRAAAQRFLLIGLAHTGSQPELSEELRAAQQMAERPSTDPRARLILLEGSAQTLAIQGAHSCWELFAQLQRESLAAGEVLVYYLGLRSQMLALLNDPGGIDRDRLQEMGDSLLPVAECHRWQRAAAQTRGIARAAGIQFRSSL